MGRVGCYDRAMQCRRLVQSFCAVLLAIGIEAHAQAPQTPRVPRIGYLAAVSAAADAPRLDAFRKELRNLGYVEGQNLILDTRHLDLEFERLPDLAAELIGTRIDVLVAVTTNAALAAKKTAATSTPIVFMGVTDPVAAKLVESLPRPGGNVTGITNMAAVLTGKRLEFLRETVPKVARVAVLWDPLAPGSLPQWKESQLPAQELKLQLHSMEVSSVDAYEPAFREAAKAGSGAIWITLNPLANSNQKTIAELAVKYRLPSICARSDYADNGCLIAYGPSYANEGRDGARYVDKILKGVRPADLPIEQPTKFELVINLATAKRMGVAVPATMLNQADRLIP
jgi:putative ABC transport system substrate-binding protein